MLIISSPAPAFSLLIFEPAARSMISLPEPASMLFTWAFTFILSLPALVSSVPTLALIVTLSLPLPVLMLSTLLFTLRVSPPSPVSSRDIWLFTVILSALVPLIFKFCAPRSLVVMLLLVSLESLRFRLIVFRFESWPISLLLKVLLLDEPFIVRFKVSSKEVLPSMFRFVFSSFKFTVAL